MLNKVKEKLAGKGKTVFIIIVVILLCVASIAVPGIKDSLDRKSCAKTAAQAEAAYAAGNLATAAELYDVLLFNEVEGENAFSPRDCPDRERALDEARRREVSIFSNALKSMEAGEFENAYYGFHGYTETYPEGPALEQAQTQADEAFSAWMQDSGQAGRHLMEKMYLQGCGGEVVAIPPLDEIIDSSLAPMYWYPGLRNSASEYVAATPASFRIAVCPTLLTTETVDTCQYTTTGSAAGMPGGTISRQRGIYLLKLVDLRTGRTVASLDTLASLDPEKCPDFKDSSLVNSRIVGAPDYSLAIPWIIGALKSLP